MSTPPLRLRISEIFASLQGESLTQGLPTLFIRLTGCPLRCHYCDTPYAFSGGDWMTLDQILTTTRDSGLPLVTVTGGEPLAQTACRTLLYRLCESGLTVSLETSGALPIEAIDRRVQRIVDLKTPGSGEVERNLYANLDHLNPQDQLKFVLTSEEDYQWAKKLIKEYQLQQRCPLLMLPAFQHLPAATLAEWILRDRLPVRMQLQLHKQLWGDQPGR